MLPCLARSSARPQGAAVERTGQPGASDQGPDEPVVAGATRPENEEGGVSCGTAATTHRASAWA